jgi:hypothetical protein
VIYSSLRIRRTVAVSVGPPSGRGRCLSNLAPDAENPGYTNVLIDGNFTCFSQPIDLFTVRFMCDSSIRCATRFALHISTISVLLFDTIDGQCYLSNENDYVLWYETINENDWQWKTKTK